MPIKQGLCEVPAPPGTIKPETPDVWSNELKRDVDRNH